jgi:hypothetical protein
MRKKLLIELFIYIAVVIVAIFLLITQNHGLKSVKIPSDYSIPKGEKGNAFISHK